MTASWSPSTTRSPARRASSSVATVPQDGGQRSGVGLDGRVGRGSAPARDRRAARRPPQVEVLLAEAQLVARAQAVGGARSEERLEGDDHGIDADLRLARREGSDAAEAPEREDDGLELLSTLGELVDPRAGGRRQRAAPQYSGGLELAQALGEDVGADVGQPRAQVGEALGAEQQLADDEQRPALADDVEGPRDPAAVAVRALRRRHGTSLPCNWFVVLVTWFFQSDARIDR